MDMNSKLVKCSVKLSDQIIGLIKQSHTLKHASSNSAQCEICSNYLLQLLQDYLVFLNINFW